MTATADVETTVSMKWSKQLRVATKRNESGKSKLQGACQRSRDLNMRANKEWDGKRV